MRGGGGQKKTLKSVREEKQVRLFVNGLRPRVFSGDRVEEESK